MAGERKNHRQQTALAALIGSVTLDEASSRSGVSRRTLERWLSEDSEFVDQLRAARARVVETSISRLQDACSAAVDTLKRNLECGSPGVEVRSAVAILEHSIRAIELYDIESRLRALETGRSR